MKIANIYTMGRQPFELVGHIMSKQGSGGPPPLQRTKKDRFSPEIQAFFRANC